MFGLKVSDEQVNNAKHGSVYNITIEELALINMAASLSGIENSLREIAAALTKGDECNVFQGDKNAQDVCEPLR